MPGPELLAEFLKTNGISRGACAKALRVSRTTLYYWLNGDTAPGEGARTDIATWTNGAVPADSWGPVVDHRKERGGEVEPFRPDAAGETPKPTGTG